MTLQSTETPLNAPDAVTDSRPVMATLCLLPLPGTQGWQGQMEDMIERLEQELYALVSAGVDAILVQNSWDNLPYSATTLPEAGIATYTHLALRVRGMLNQQPRRVQLGISVLPNHPQVAVAIAQAVGADFIHVPTLAGNRITETGMLPGQLHALTQAYQQLYISPQSLPVWVDITENHLIPTSNGQRPWQNAQHYGLNVLRNTLQQNRNQASASGVELNIQAVLVSVADPALLTNETITDLLHVLDEESPQTRLLLAPATTDATMLSTLKKRHAPAGAGQSVLGLALGNAFRKPPLHAHDAMPAMDAFKVEQWCHEFKTGKTILEATADAGNAAIKEHKARQQATDADTGTKTNTNTSTSNDTEANPPRKCPFSGLGLPGFGK